MGRRRTGSVLPHGDRFKAFVGKDYLGIFDTEPEAWRKVKAFLAFESKGSSANTSLRVYGDGFFDAREKAGRVRRVEKERSVWRHHILTGPFVDWPMRKVKDHHIQDYFNALLAKKAVSTITTKQGVVHRETDRTLDRQTVVHVRRICKDIWAQAKIDRKVTSNPFIEVKVPRVDQVQEDEDYWTYLTPDEIDALLDMLDGQVAAAKPGSARCRHLIRVRALYAVAIYAGLRDGELLGLRWPDVALDSQKPLVKVRRSYDGPTKTKGSRREVPLLPRARAALIALRAEGGVIRAQGLVWPSDHGGCYHEGYDGGWPDKSQRIMGKLRVAPGWRSRAGIRDYVRFHDLRHSCASHLRMGTWGRAFSLGDIMAWMGHSDIKTTLRYAHLGPENLHEKVRLMLSDRPKIDRTLIDDDTSK